jgi:hypothetical protein
MKRILPILCVIFIAITTSAQFMDNEVPAYHPNPPAKGEKLPPILSPDQLNQADLKYDSQRLAYQAATRIPRVIYQLPCYCFCDRSAGHKSLHSCFEGEHGAHCGTCIQESLYAYQMTKSGRTVKQIREGIMRGDYKTIDVRKFKGPLA